MPRPRYPTLVDMLEARAAEGDGRGFTFLDDGETDGPRLTFAALDRRARALGALLQERGLAGERVLLMYPPGLDFIAGFFGCLYARSVAVPVYPPDPSRLERSLPRLEAVAVDADAAALLSTEAVLALADEIIPLAPGLAGVQRLAGDAVDPSLASAWRRPDVGPDALAFLQYTSGSTSLPKGVMVRHGELLHNEAQIEAALRRDRDARSVNWLPMFHDMGLIGAVLQPVYSGSDAWLFSPLDFLARPIRWLRAIDRHRAHTSAAPNFAYDLCARKVTDAEAASLDLRSWQFALSGAEPVRAETLDRFAARFAASGFSPATFYPCYGLAEATLFVSGGAGRSPPRRLRLDAAALSQGLAKEAAPQAPDARSLVSCGFAWPGTDVAVVDPARLTRCDDGAVGEVWVRGASVAQGYFRRDAESARVFGAALDGDGRWLRTGDLGFVRDGELYVTGRLKDVIIVAGRNHYPQDVEWTVEHADPRVRRGCSACFALEVDGVERVAVACELDPRRGDGDLDALAGSLRAAVAAHHGVRLHAVAFVRAGTIPKTTSSKIQRRACRDAFERGALDELHRWVVRGDRASSVPDEPRRVTPAPAEPAPLPAPPAALVHRCVAALRVVLDEPTLSVDLDAPLAHLGLDSVQVMDLKSELEAVAGRAVPLPALRDARTLRELCVAVAPPDEPSAPDGAGDPWAEHVNPFVAAQLRALALDVRYVRGDGCHVEDESGRRYLDVTAAYGALPFGFNPPEVWAALFEAARAMPPSLVQPSRLDAAGRLARALAAVAPPGLRYVTFANSGAEANEAAIKMARSATGRLGVVSADSGFHGKTLGALSATGRSSYQRAFGAPAPGFVRVPFGDVDALERALAARPGEVAAVMLEVVQGEGGIRVAPAGYLRAVRACCDRHDVLLIVDEVQTGLGRTGALFACEAEGVAPDILTLAKALGGGLVPVGAVLANGRAFNEEFALRHSSTFAGNALGALVGLRSLDLVTRDGRALVRHVAACGEVLTRGLAALRERFPAIVREARGRGFMHGVELTDDPGAFGRQGLLASMAAQGTLAYLLCSHLLHAEGIRIAPALLGSRVLRIEPPLVATRAMCDELLAALRRCFERVERCDTDAVAGHLVGRTPPPDAGEAPRRVAVRPGDAGDEGRWGFVFHPLDHRSYADFDPSLAGYNDGELRALVERLRGVSLRDAPSSLLLGGGRVASPAGARAYGELFAVPSTAAELVAMPTEEAVARVREAACYARDRGARVVGLGAYTSIVTRNGERLGDLGVPVTTGNGLTVVAAVDVVLRAAARRGVALADATVAVVGATGSIGRAVAVELAPHVGRLTLVGNPARPGHAEERLAHVAADVLAALREPGARGSLAARARDADVAALAAEGRLVLRADANADLTGADIVVSATSSPHALLGAGQLGRGAIVCDVSRPSNLAPGLAEARPDLLVLEGGVVALPPGVDLGVSFGLAPGLLYACMAETALLALARREDAVTRGDDLPRAHLATLRRLAAEHGFTAVAARGGRPLGDDELARGR